MSSLNAPTSSLEPGGQAARTRPAEAFERVARYERARAHAHERLLRHEHAGHALEQARLAAALRGQRRDLDPRELRRRRGFEQQAARRELLGAQADFVAGERHRVGQQPRAAVRREGCRHALEDGAAAARVPKTRARSSSRGMAVRSGLSRW